MTCFVHKGGGALWTLENKYFVDRLQHLFPRWMGLVPSETTCLCSRGRLTSGQVIGRVHEGTERSAHLSVLREKVLCIVRLAAVCLIILTEAGSAGLCISLVVGI